MTHFYAGTLAAFAKYMYIPCMAHGLRESVQG